MRRSKFDYIYFLLVVLSFFYLIYTGMLELFYGRLVHYGATRAEYSVPVLSTLIPLALIVPNLLLNSKFLLNFRSKIVALFFLYSLGILITFFLLGQATAMGSVHKILRLCLPVFYFFYFVVYFNNYPQYLDVLIKLMGFGVVVFSVLSIQLNNVIKSLAVVDLASVMAYFPLLMLPFALSCRNNWRLIFIVSITIAIFFASKRGGLIALFLALAVYFVIEELLLKSKYKLKHLFYIIFSMSILYFGLTLFVHKYDSQLLERMENIREDQGSGRFEIWENIIDLMAKSNLSEWTIGHGIGGVYQYTNFSAHNDFLEVLFNYGFFTFVVYMLIHMCLIKKTIRLIKIKSVFAASFAASYVVFFILSCVSHIVVYPWFPILSVFWGVVFGMTKETKRSPLTVY